MRHILLGLWLTVAGIQGSSQQRAALWRTPKERLLVDGVCRCATLSGGVKLSAWFSADQTDIVSEMAMKLGVPVLLNAKEAPRREGLETRRPCDLVVVLSETRIEGILDRNLWNVNTRFLIFSRDAARAETAFAYFWKFKVVNVFAMIERNKSVAVYGFSPYSRENCEAVKLVMVDEYQRSTGNFVNGGSTFNDPIKISNMRGCPVNVTTVHVKPITIFPGEGGIHLKTSRLGGIEGNLMREVARKLNFDPTFRTPGDGAGWGWIRPAPRGAVGDVFTGGSDFANGLLAPTVERYENLDVSVPYNGRECITYGVPNGAGASTPGWINILLYEFTAVAWLLIFVSCLFVYYVFYAMNKYSRVQWFSEKSDIFLYEFSSCLGLPIKIPDYLFVKLTVLTWILFSFVTTVAYKSSISSKLTVPKEDPDINTFEELLRSRLVLTGYNNMLRLMQYNESDPAIKKMVERFTVTDFDINYAVDVIAKERKIAYMRHTSTFLYYSLINPQSKGKIHVMKDCVLSYQPIIATKKNSPFSYRLNQLISWLMESGIVSRWRSEYIYPVPAAQKSFHKLSIQHMYGVFFVLLFGLFIGLATFLIELLSHRRNGSKAAEKPAKRNVERESQNVRSHESTFMVTTMLLAAGCITTPLMHNTGQ